MGYPMEPPAFIFEHEMWHPNVFPDGRICISNLHPPGEDAMSGEMACERWSPAQNVETILMSTVSMLNDPNTNSPANVDASVMFRHALWSLCLSFDANVVQGQTGRVRKNSERAGRGEQ